MSQNQGQVLSTLPLSDLFGAPFLAAAAAAGEMSENTGAYIRNFGMDQSGNVFMTSMSSYFDIPLDTLPDVSGEYLVDPSSGFLFAATAGVVNNVRYVAFPSTSLVTDGGVPTGYKQRIGSRYYYADTAGRLLFAQGTRSINIPLISLLNVPSLMIDTINVDFTINIKTQTIKKVEISQGLNVATNFFANVNRGGFSAGFSLDTRASITSSARADSQTNTESTYKVKMRARQIDPPGMRALFDFITNNRDTSARKTIQQGGVIADDTSIAF
jgi:hypothetical protein